MRNRKTKVTIWIIPEIKQFLEMEGSKFGYSIGETITAMVTGQKFPKYVPSSELSEAQLLRGTSIAHKSQWRGLQGRFQRLKYELFKGDEERFMEVFGDIVEEAQEYLRARDEVGLEKLSNSGRIAQRRMDYINSRKVEFKPSSEARSVFERVGRGEFVGEVSSKED